jgi:GxxExxY protein
MADESKVAEYPLADLTESIIAAGIEVHRTLGPGYLEKIYENAMVLELGARGHQVARQLDGHVVYRGQAIGKHRLDLLVDDQVVVELKSVEALASVHAAQLRSTLKAAGKKVGLLMNFNQEVLVKGLKRVIN